MKISVTAYADVSSGDAIQNDVSAGDAMDNDVSAGGVQEAVDKPEDVISVLLPTEFDVSMIIDPKKGTGFVMSQEIMIINKSDFPVNINIRSAQYQVNREQAGEKDVEIFMNLKQFKQPDTTFPMSEGASLSPITVTLDARSQGTDVQKLQQEDTVQDSTDAVSSADYAVINFEGTMGKGDWKDGDLKIQIVYDLERVVSGGR